MSNFNGAYFVVRGTAFAVVLVKPQAMASERTREDVTEAFSRYFPQVPIVLATETPNGNLTFWGREDLIDYLARRDVSINWCNYSTD